MRKRLSFPVAATFIAAICVCVTICWAAQAAAKYVVDQEKKNALIESAGENVNALRSCLAPHSRMPRAGTTSGDQKNSSELIVREGSSNK